MANSQRSKGLDILDQVMIVLAVLLALTGLAVWAGYGLVATALWIGFLLLAYTQAPARKFPTVEKITEGVDLTGKVALVTGVTSGIGVDTARGLALRGAKVYLAARNPKKLEVTKKELEEAVPGAKFHILTCDLSDLESVKKAAQEFLKQDKKLDILINNAGIMALPERRATAQGLEQQVGVCHVGHFYLFKLLKPALSAAGTPTSPSRVAALSSSGHRLHKITELLQTDKLETEPYDPWVGYGNAKCSNMLFAKGLHDLYHEKEHIAGFSVMPGGIHTGLQEHVDWYTMLKWIVVTPFFFKSTSQGAATSLLCATKADPKTEGGKYFDNCKATDALEKIEEEVGKDAASQLWKKSEQVLADLGFTK